MGVTIGVSLPRASEVTAVLTEPRSHDVSAEKLERIRERLVAGVSALPGMSEPGPPLVIDVYKLGRALSCPDQCAGTEDEFRPNPALVRRAVGILALSRAVKRRPPMAPADAVAELLAEVEDGSAIGDPAYGSGAFWWGPWYVSLDPWAKSVVLAEASRWASAAWSAVDWQVIGGVPSMGGYEWWDVPPNRRVALKGRADVVIRLGNGTAGRVGEHSSALVVCSGLPPGTWGVELAFPALVTGMRRGPRALPGRVVGIWPECGQVRVLDTDETSLAGAASAALSAAAAWSPGQGH